ncbi:MAG TPA: hypothetical protein VFF28_01240 [Candidatus Nanoarchaeia archaeon]|nr:hypothetical protein [Candidatus Nanoarchaeia archaeon]
MKLKSSKDNNKSRMEFVKYWAEYVRTHSDREWSKQQNVLINSQIQSARAVKMTREQYLRIKGEL